MSFRPQKGYYLCTWSLRDKDEYRGHAATRSPTPALRHQVYDYGHRESEVGKESKGTLRGTLNKQTPRIERTYNRNKRNQVGMVLSYLCYILGVPYSGSPESIPFDNRAHVSYGHISGKPKEMNPKQGP